MKTDISPLCVAILGGGPAGLMAAELLAKKGVKVTVYDQMPTVGRKFMMAGRGGLNLTHSEPLAAFLARYRAAAPWLEPVLQAFPPAALRDWADSLGAETFVGSSGRVFPKQLKASPLLRAWLQRLDKLGVNFALRHRWNGWGADGALLLTDAVGQEVRVHADATLLALGGASWPRLGSDGGWVEKLRGQGVKVATLRPANCGFVAPWSAVFRDRFAGQPVKPLKASFAGQSLQGEAMITATGLEGGIIYALSAPLRDAIEQKGEAIIELDLRPGLSRDELVSRLQAPRGGQSVSNYLRKVTGVSPVALGLMRESLGGAVLPVTEEGIADLMKHTKIKLTATTSLARAISSAGGIVRDEVNPDFMLNKKAGVFVCGEMLDWEAPTGGYLLQGCFSTAVAAAKGIEAYLMSSAA